MGNQIRYSILHLLIDGGKNIQPELYKDIWNISRVRVNVAVAVKVNHVLT